MTEWQVKISERAQKQVGKLDQSVHLALRLLVSDLKLYGPIPGFRWRNYSKFKGKSQDKRHCHLIRGKPTYVCCWEVFKREKEIEVYYVGTHEKAPY